MTTATKEKLFALRTQSSGSRVDREQKVIRGVVVLKKGPARGHGLEIDDAALDALVALGNADPDGIKSRFAHPEEDAQGGRRRDGLGSYLGRFKNFRREGDLARADLYLAASAFATPGGDLGTYVLNLAEEDPGAFGASIVFSARKQAQGGGKSPLVRFTGLRGVDLVDDPAATHGLFSSLTEVEEMSTTTTTNDAAAEAKAAEEKAAAEKAAADKAAAEKAAADAEVKAAAAAKKSADELVAAAKDEAIKFATKRATDIVALCARAGQADKANELIADTTLSLNDVREKLFDGLCAKNKVVGDGGGSAGDPQPADEDAAFKAEYAKDAKRLKARGISEADYVFSRRVDDGLEVLRPNSYPNLAS